MDTLNRKHKVIDTDINRNAKYFSSDSEIKGQRLSEYSGRKREKVKDKKKVTDKKVAEVCRNVNMYSARNTESQNHGKCLNGNGNVRSGTVEPLNSVFKGQGKSLSKSAHKIVDKEFQDLLEHVKKNKKPRMKDVQTKVGKFEFFYKS